MAASRRTKPDVELFEKKRDLKERQSFKDDTEKSDADAYLNGRVGEEGSRTKRYDNNAAASWKRRMKSEGGKGKRQKAMKDG